MLEKVRRRMKSGATYVLVAGLTVIFMFFFGVPTQNCGGAAGPGARNANAVLASVAGEEIVSKDVNIVYNRIFGTDTNTDENEYQQRRASSLRSMILIELFAERARQAGLRVSEKELTDYMQDAARNFEYRFMYGRSGEFNGHYYKAYVQNRLRTSLSEYEDFKREELLARNYLAMHAAQIAVPETELQSAHAIKNTNMNLAFVGLSPDNLEKSVEVTDDDLATYLEENQKKVEEYYENNKKKEFSQPAEMKIRRIYIPKPSDSAKEAAAKNRWKEAQKRVFDEGEDVGTVAAELGESIPGQEKGMMGWSNVENMDQNIVDALEGTEVGTKKRVETEGAYMIVKLEDKKEAKVQPLEEVREEIARTLIRQDRVDALVKDVTDKLHEKAAETGSLKEALTALQEESDKKVWKDLDVQETGEFTLEGQSAPPGLAAQLGGQMPNFGSWSKIPKIGDSQKLAVDAYKKLTEENPVPDQVYDVGSTKYIVRLKSKKGPEEKEAPESLVNELSNKKINEMLGRWSAIFTRPMNDYGPWIERQLEEAVDDGSVEVYPKNSPVAQIVHQGFQPGGDGSGGKATKGSPIKIGGGQKGGGSKTIKIGGGEGGGSKKIDLKQLKKQMKMKQKAAGGETEGSAPSEGESGGSESGGSE